MKKLFLLAIFIAAGFIFIFGKRTNYYFASASQAKADDSIKNTGKDYECSDGWRITGYFTPIETDYSSGETREVEIKDAGKFSFDNEFLRVVFDEDKGYGEGWGKTRFGWYLGNYNGRWHKADAPLDANNSALEPNSIAVDNSLIPNDSMVKIPGLPGDYGKKNYIANDVGVTIEGKRIDIYTGEGKAAEREMYRITRDDEDDLQQVCFQKPE